MTKENIKRHLISLGITFVASFFLVVGFQLSDPNFVFTIVAIKAVVLSGLIAATRAVAKIVYEICYNLLSTKE